MSGSGGIGQLFKGLVMGIVLILAIIGTMSMLDNSGGDGENSASSSIDTIENSSTPALDVKTPLVKTPDIKAPDIIIASQNAGTPNIAIKSPAVKPVLENEKTAKEVKEELEALEKAKIQYGILKLSSKNPNNQKTLIADYVIFNHDNKKVAESNNSSSASYRLPVGNYKVVTTLVQSPEATTRNVEPVQSTQNITVNADKLTNKIFELEPPVTIGVLQVSAINAENNQATKANFIIQKENGITVASRQNVSNSLFKLKAGSYKVTVKNGNNSDFRTIVVEPGKSVTEVFKLQKSFLQGKVLVRIFDIKTNKPLAADIEISSTDGKIMQALKAVSQTEIALAASDYTIKVTGANGVSSKNITVIAGRASSQTFRIDAPVVDTPVTASPVIDAPTEVKDIAETTKNDANKPVLINNNVSISGVKNETPQSSTPPVTQEAQKQESSVGSLKLFARNSRDQKPIKSNFYVQTPNGKHVAKTIYADTATFKLKPGNYKITVRATNRNNIVRNIQIAANQTISQAFSLTQISPATAPKAPKTEEKTRRPVLAPPKPAKIQKVIPNGFLHVVMQPAKNTHFIIADNKGKKVVELTSVPSGNFKLDTGIYRVTAILKGQRRNQSIQVHQGKTSRLVFNSRDFQQNATPPRTNNPTINKGGLRSRIVDNAGRPLKGNLTVTNLRGQVVARANNVTFGEFDLPATPHTVSVNYKGLSGSERVNITAGNTTVQTFTISPTHANRSSPTKNRPVQQPRNIKELLREKLEQELKKAF